MIEGDRNLYLIVKEDFISKYGVNFGMDNNERLTAIVLLCNITQTIKKTSPDTLVVDVINKLIKDTDIATKEFWIKISLQCEALLEGDQVDFPDFGFKELKDKANKIKQINENILPF